MVYEYVKAGPGQEFRILYTQTTIGILGILGRVYVYVKAGPGQEIVPGRVCEGGTYRKRLGPARN